MPMRWGLLSEEIPIEAESARFSAITKSFPASQGETTYERT